jgi:hypothetical protein
MPQSLILSRKPSLPTCIASGPWQNEKPRQVFSPEVDKAAILLSSQVSVTSSYKLLGDIGALD